VGAYGFGPLRPESPKLKPKAESKGGILGEGKRAPSAAATGVWGSTVNSPSRVWGGALAANAIWA